jgi:hypothetical protein
MITREEILDGLEEIVAARGQSLGWTSNERAIDRFIGNVQDKRCTNEEYKESIERVIRDFSKKEFGPKPPAVLNRIDGEFKAITQSDGCDKCVSGIRTLYKLSGGMHESTQLFWCDCSAALDNPDFDKNVRMRYDEVAFLMDKNPGMYLLKGSDPDQTMSIMKNAILARGDNHNMARKIDALMEGDYTQALSFTEYSSEEADAIPF